MHQIPVSGLSVVGAGAYSAPAGRDFPSHKHECWELVYYRTGNIQCPIGDRIYSGLPGVLLLTPPGIYHAEIAATAYSNYYIAVNAPVDYSWPTECFDDARQTLAFLCSSIVKECALNGADRSSMLMHLAGLLDLQVRRYVRQAQVGDAERIVVKAEEIIEERYASDLRVDGIAEELGVSKSSLYVYFERVRGCTPIAHLQTVRLRNALMYLKNSSLTLEAIAAFCGFDSASHLSRRVKDTLGMRPGEYRNGSRKS
jgi:AraC-like DNA-binding protein